MKLRNKKTGEVKEVIVGGYPVSGKTKMWECSEMDANEEDGYKSLGTYTSLAELEDEWEDFVGHWYLDSDGEIICEPAENKSSFDNDCEQIGNYFETKEEAEKAVEKLKAWKRLKDKGFKFKDWNCAMKELYFDVPDDFFPNKSYYTSSITEETKKDLDLLFGGEE